MQFEVLDVCVMEGRNTNLPKKAHREDAGIDFFAPNDMETVVLQPGEDIVIQTGLRVAVPYGYALLGVNKSGVATKKKLVLGAKLIDCGYTGELGIHLINVGTKETTINPGDKIAQFVLIPIGYSNVNIISEEQYKKIYGKSERGDGGFGSTGNKWHSDWKR